MTNENKFNLRENADFPQKIVVKSSDIETIVGDLTEKLGAKQKLVLSSRFGISGAEPQTLESIGKSLDITRERVRQIEADALSVLKKIEKNKQTEELFSTALEVISEKGGIAKTENLANEVFERYFGRRAKDIKEKYLIEVLFSVIGLKRIKGNKELEDAWTSKDFDIKKFRNIVSGIEKIFDESKKLFSEEELLKKIDILSQTAPELQIEPEKILNYLEISKKFGKNIFGQWGKAKWPLVRPRGVREKATLVLLNRKKPLHFREISQLIEKMGLSDKKVHPQTVHNELIRDKRFVLVGRGTYALREWGFEEGTVKDIIVSLIKSAGGF
ncbi:MAG TPA: sigma factor-like helix-turn-helix DNA-binding protein, partial [Candidatus Bathyarchaeia archaeon]|nr:sigma factor-like helix-turn-helix DNA-binding protein [Candidatus Bathyarchaeia archaeon]